VEEGFSSPHPQPLSTSREGRLRWTFCEEFYFVPEWNKFWIDGIKIRIDTTISQCSTARKIDFFSFTEGLELLLHETDPLGFCLIGHDARTHKNTLLISEKRTLRPLVREVFIGFAPENFVLHRLHRFIREDRIFYFAVHTALENIRQLLASYGQEIIILSAIGV